MTSDKIAEKIALVRALRNASKILKDIDTLSQDVDNIRKSMQRGFVAQAVVTAGNELEAVLMLLTAQYEGDYDEEYTL